MDLIDAYSLGRMQLLRYVTRDWEITVQHSKTNVSVCCGQHRSQCITRVSPSCLLNPTSRCATCFLRLLMVSVRSFRSHTLLISW